MLALEAYMMRLIMNIQNMRKMMIIFLMMRKYLNLLMKQKMNGWIA
jgi:hypothetical protein